VFLKSIHKIWFSGKLFTFLVVEVDFLQVEEELEVEVPIGPMMAVDTQEVGVDNRYSILKYNTVSKFLTNKSMKAHTHWWRRKHR